MLEIFTILDHVSFFRAYKLSFRTAHVGSLLTTGN